MALPLGRPDPQHTHTHLPRSLWATEDCKMQPHFSSSLAERTQLGIISLKVLTVCFLPCVCSVMLNAFPSQIQSPEWLHNVSRTESKHSTSRLTILQNLIPYSLSLLPSPEKLNYVSLRDHPLCFPSDTWNVLSRLRCACLSSSFPSAHRCFQATLCISYWVFSAVVLFVLCHPSPP